MYSKSFVGEPKNGDPSGLGTCGETQTSQAASIASAWRRSSSPVSLTRDRRRARDVVADLLPQAAVADQHELRLRQLLHEPGQQPDAVPEPERADETDGRQLGEPEPCAPPRRCIAG